MRLIPFLSLILFLSFSCKQAAPKPKAVVDEPLVLHHLVRPPANNVANPPVLILLHGLGSNAKDLFSFAKIIPQDWLVISARAPYGYPNIADRFKWYDLKFVGDKRIANHEEMEKSRQLILKFIDQVKKKYKVDEQRIVLGGFSQGAIMSYNVGLLTPEKVAGIVSFSGEILEKIKPKIVKSKELENLKVFVSHGEKDGKLPYAGALEAQKLLNAMGVPATYSFDQARHTISNQHRTDFLKWLAGM